MLQVIRERAQGVFAWIIVGAITLSFALFGLNSYFSDTSEGYQAALVNDEQVSVNEYRIAYSNERERIQQMFGGNIDMDMFDDQIKQSAMKRVIDNAVLIQEASGSGMSISDEQLSYRIQNFEEFSDDGAFSKALYDQQLDRMGESSAGFEYRMRRGLVADQLVNGIISSSFATKDEIELTVRLRDQAREVGYITIPTETFKSDVEVSDADVKTYFEANTNNYKTEEKVLLEYLELKVDDLIAAVELDDSELEDYYEDQRDRFLSAEERRTSHILVEFGDDSDAAKEKIQAIYQKVIAGTADFAAIAKESSEDIGSALDGGDLGFFARGFMDDNYEDVAFSMSIGEISEPVRSAFGYHIIQLNEIQPSEGKQFSEVKTEIEVELRKAKAEKLYIDKVELLANLTYETPDTLETAKEELGLEIKISPLVSQRGAVGIFGNRKIIDAAFSDDVLNENMNSEMIELNSAHSVVVRLKEHKPSVVKPLAEVQAEIKTQLINEKVLAKAKSISEELSQRIKAGVAAEDVASESSYRWNEKKWIKRDDSTLPQEITQAVFAMSRISDGDFETKGISLNNGDYALAIFSGLKDGDVATLADEDMKQIIAGIANATGVDAFTALLKSLNDEAEVKRFPGNL